MKVYSKDLRLKLETLLIAGWLAMGSVHPLGARRDHPGWALISQAEVRSGMVFTLRLRTTGSILIKTAVRSGLRRNGRCVIRGVLTRFDPNLTLTPTQYPAIVGKRGNKKLLTYAEFAIPCNPLQRLSDHS